jgi:prolyl oligopeptidase
MYTVTTNPPFSPNEPVAEVLHGVSVNDPYRWLEDQDAPRTRAWIGEQNLYARTYLDSIPVRERTRQRIREFLAVETHDSLQKVGNWYFFRKRSPDQEQPCIYMREGADGQDRLLLDPAERGTGKYTAVKPLRASADGRLLLYEVKQGGERTGVFEIFDIAAGKTLPDTLGRGYLRGFAFAPDSGSFYYVHEPLPGKSPMRNAAYHHTLGTPSSDDREIFCPGQDERLRMCLASDATHLGFLVSKFLEKTYIDFYIQEFETAGPPDLLFADAVYSFGPRLVSGKLFAITDRDAPNLRIVEIPLGAGREPEWVDIVPETDARIETWVPTKNAIYVSYVRGAKILIRIFDFSGREIADIPVRDDETARLVAGSCESDEVLLESESFSEPIRILRYPSPFKKPVMWARRDTPFDSSKYGHKKVSYTSKDGTRIPMFVMGRHDVLNGGTHPVILTAYGGYGVSITPQFSVFVAFLVERGCLFALPNIRGGSEFGAEWHNAAKRHNRQTAYDDFLCAAEWLIATRRTTSEKLAIFGGSNSGLLVGVALTQRPDLFRAVVCMVPMLDMLRYHLFDDAHMWKEEFGTVHNPDDFRALIGYSPYHHVRDQRAYPATMIVSGDADHNCNPFHARKMTARLQAANSSPYPIFLDYSQFRGHSPVLPFSVRLEALTDRVGFLCDQLGIAT